MEAEICQSVRDHSPRDRDVGWGRSDVESLLPGEDRAHARNPGEPTHGAGRRVDSCERVPVPIPSIPFHGIRCQEEVATVYVGYRLERRPREGAVPQLPAVGGAQTAELTRVPADHQSRVRHGIQLCDIRQTVWAVVLTGVGRGGWEVPALLAGKVVTDKELRIDASSVRARIAVAVGDDPL